MTPENPSATPAPAAAGREDVERVAAKLKDVAQGRLSNLDLIQETARQAAELLAAMPTSEPAPQQGGYVTAFYEIAKMLGIGARVNSPAEVWEREMKPLLQRLVDTTPPPAAAGEPVADALAKALCLLDTFAGEGLGHVYGNGTTLDADTVCADLCDTAGIELEPGWYRQIGRLYAAPVASAAPAGDGLDPDVRRRLESVCETLETNNAWALPVGFGQLAADIRAALQADTGKRDDAVARIVAWLRAKANADREAAKSCLGGRRATRLLESAERRDADATAIERGEWEKGE